MKELIYSLDHGTTWRRTIDRILYTDEAAQALIEKCMDVVKNLMEKDYERSCQATPGPKYHNLEGLMVMADDAPFPPPPPPDDPNPSVLAWRNGIKQEEIKA